jgi:alkanesulfonate monooxygenase SsuD/methylene tetrahydromethanopterin reductase-like flavin-dependent oxidoreductase (luciferase family)
MTAPVPFLARLAADAGDMRVGPGTIAPVQRPASPVRRAANSDKTVARAARLADTWPVDPHATLQTTTQQVALFHAARADAGRGPGATLPAITEAFCARDRATALELAGPAGAGTFRVPAPGQDQALPGQENVSVALDQPGRDRFVIGSPEERLEQLLPWRERLGVATSSSGRAGAGCPWTPRWARSGCRRRPSRCCGRRPAAARADRSAEQRPQVLRPHVPAQPGDQRRDDGEGGPG